MVTIGPRCLLRLLSSQHPGQRGGPWNENREFQSGRARVRTGGYALVIAMVFFCRVHDVGQQHHALVV